MSNHHQTFSHVHRVSYAECTLGNHVYYARYLDLLEEARGEFFRSLGFPLLELQTGGTIFPVVEAHVFYKGPACYDDLLRIDLWVTQLGPVRLGFSYSAVNQSGALLIEASTLQVCTAINNQPKRLPAELLGKLSLYGSSR
jgi:acyl-CoA thioester hydrolase